jgi:uncharacterized lipoprotein YddW (UPF0748 family)
MYFEVSKVPQGRYLLNRMWSEAELTASEPPMRLSCEAAAHVSPPSGLRIVYSSSATDYASLHPRLIEFRACGTTHICRNTSFEAAYVLAKVKLLILKCCLLQNKIPFPKARICLITAIALFFYSFTRAEDYPKHEVRGVWLSTIYGMDWPTVKATNEATRKAQQKELCDKLDIIKETNFNTVFLQVRMRGDVIYPSAIEPISRFITGRSGLSPGYDPLAFAIEECRKRGLECHAWIVTYPLGTPQNVLLEGGQSIVSRRPELCRFFQGQWYLDPGLPETSDYVLSIVNEIVSRYDVDGLHLDYIRYPDGGEMFPDLDTYHRYGGNISLHVWRQNNINRLVSRIYDRVKELKPWVQVSTSPLGKYAALPTVPNAGQTGLSVYQDSYSWLRNQKQDMIVPMMYFRDNFFYPFVEHWMQNRYGRLLVAGLGAYRLSPSDADWPLAAITAQIDYLREEKADGLAFFRGQQIFSNHKGLRDALKNNYFKRPALLPPLSWLSTEAPQPPEGLSIERDGDMLRIAWQAADNNERLTYTVYAAEADDVDTNKASTVVATRLRDSEMYFRIDSPEREQGMSFRVTASNRYHIESRPSDEVYYYVSAYVK